MNDVVILMSIILCLFSLSCGRAREENLKREIIVFDSDRDGNSEIYLTNPLGDILRRLTKNPASDQYPRLSPDKKWVVFMSDRDGNMEIYIMDILGNNQRRLTSHPALDQQPSWEPSGQRIVFCSARAGGGNLYTIKPDGTDLEQLTHYQRSWCGTPLYSPDGGRIAITYRSRPRHRWRAAVLEMGDMSLWKISRSALGNCRPAWSPDGKQIAFVKHESKPNTDIWLYNLGSKEFKRLTNHPASDYNPSFSPDGRRIVFQSRRDSDRNQLYILNLKTGRISRLTYNNGNDGSPDWG